MGQLRIEILSRGESEGDPTKRLEKVSDFVLWYSNAWWDFSKDKGFFCIQWKNVETKMYFWKADHQGWTFTMNVARIDNDEFHPNKMKMVITDHEPTSFIWALNMKG